MVLHALLSDKVSSTGSSKLGRDFRSMAGKYLFHVSLVIALLNWVNFLQLFWKLSYSIRIRKDDRLNYTRQTALMELIT